MDKHSIDIIVVTNTTVVIIIVIVIVIIVSNLPGTRTSRFTATFCKKQV